MVKPRYMSQNRQSHSLNYFNSYAVKDRINLSGYCNLKPFIPTNVNFDDILPSRTMHPELIKNFTVLISRILVDNLPVFKYYFEDVVIRHISHQYSKQMSQKSEVVCLIDINFLILQHTRSL